MFRHRTFVRGLFILFLLAGLLAGFGAPSLPSNVRAAPLKANLRDVVISEVAWAGTATSTSDEWIELYNTTNSSINLTGWTLAADDGDPNIALTGTIPANGYYLLENGDDSTISDVAADQIYSGTLNNNPSADILRLKDGSAFEVDSANRNGGAWDAGTTGSGIPPFASMERNGVTPDGNAGAWFSNNGITRNGLDASGNPINGTPHNSQTDLSLTMNVDDATPSVGSNITFTITVTNGGTYNATNVSVKDVFPTAGLIYQSDTGLGSYNLSTGIWTIGTIANGATATLSITAQVTGEGVKTNRAEIWTADQFDPDSTPGNGITTEDDYALAKATTPGATALDITNIVNNPNPNVGTNVVFTITASNSGPDAATNVEVAALLPAGLNFISYSGSVGSYNGGSGIWTIGTLAINASATLDITARVVTTNPLPYSATVSSSEYLDSTATVTLNNPLPGEADLSLTHDPLMVSTSIADQVALKLRLHNAGPDTATGVQIRDLLPSGLDYVSYSSTVGTYNGTTGIWTVDSLASGAADALLTINVKVDSGGTSTQNFAEVWHSDQYDPDSTPANGDVGEDDNTSLEVPVADLNLAERVDIAGSNAIFTLTLRNSGPDDASGVRVKTGLPALTSVYTFTSYGSTLGTYDSVGGIWTVGALVDGASATLTITTTTSSSSLLVNWVEVSASDQVDPNSVPNNNSRAEDDDASAPATDLFLTQSVNNGNPDVNTNVVFTITVGNSGIAGTTNVQVKDLLPSGLTYVSDDGGGAYSSSSGIWSVGTMTSGASRTLNITATVAVFGIKTNWAEVWRSDEYDADSTPGNGSTTEDDDASATITSYRSVIINEVAWGGTAASPNDEWLELYNPSSASINITGWSLRSTSGSFDVTLSGTISAGGYFLLEREDNSTVSDVTADQIYTGGTSNLLSDAGEVLTLQDSLANFIDTANHDGGPWPKGSNSGNHGTMERLGTSTESDSTWVTNLGNPKNGRDANNGLIYGTPRRVNSRGAAPVPTSTPYRPPTPKPVGRMVINEFLPRAGFDWNNDGTIDVGDEFIEVENLGPVDVDLKNWRLDDEPLRGSDQFTLPSHKLRPGERAIFYGSTTHILLDDSGDTVRLLNPSGVVVDAYTYTAIKYPDQTYCRIPDGTGLWKFPCFPTQGTENALTGILPSAPTGQVYQPPVCLFADTVPQEFRQAECNGFGADIWNRKYWDDQAGENEFVVPDRLSKWQTIVE